MIKELNASYMKRVYSQYVLLKVVINDPIRGTGFCLQAMSENPTVETLGQYVTRSQINGLK